MPKHLFLKAVALLVLTLFSLDQEALAQGSSRPARITPPVTIQTVHPEIAYTVSMSRRAVKLTLFRYDKLREFEVTASADNRKGYSIIPLEAATEAQRNLLKQYLNADLK